eukprot:1142370-Pelagomonas_calceolata.AAC.1
MLLQHVKTCKDWPACEFLQGLQGSLAFKGRMFKSASAETHWPVSSNAAAAPAHWERALGSFLFLAVDAPPAPS